MADSPKIKQDYNSRPHVLVVDDDKRICELVSRYLTAQDFIVVQAHDASGARNMLMHFEFDVMVVDVMMPGETGLSLAADINATRDTPILLLTAMSESEDRIAGLEAGADDYLTKPFEPRELVLRLQAILKRTRRAAPQETKLQIGEWVFDPAALTIVSGGETVGLSAVEVKLLQVLASHHGQAVSRADLAAEADIEAAERSIDVQITRLRKKMGEDPKMPRYLQTVRGKGYLLRAAPVTDGEAM